MCPHTKDAPRHRFSHPFEVCADRSHPPKPHNQPTFTPISSQPAQPHPAAHILPHSGVPPAPLFVMFTEQDQGELTMLPKPSDISVADDRRDTGRIQCNELRTNIGEIVDASSTGLRIKGKLPLGTKPHSIVMINITSDMDTLSLQCEVRWIKKQAFKGMSFGVAFQEISEDQRRQLWQMVRTGNIITNCSRFTVAA